MYDIQLWFTDKESEISALQYYILLVYFWLLQHAQYCKTETSITLNFIVL